MDDRTPAWFIADSTLTSVGERREANARASALDALQQIFPETSVDSLRTAVDAGGDLTVIVDRVLATQVVAQAEAAEAASSSATIPDGPAASTLPAATVRPKRRVRFAGDGAGPSSAGGGASFEQMQCAGSSSTAPAGEPAMSRLSDEELSEQMEASGITAEPTAGSARSAAFAAWAEGATVGIGNNLEDLGVQSVAQLALGALRIDARVVKTANELEGGMLSEKIVTKFVIEVRQLGFGWEVHRRYSEFHRFHELLSLQWADLPPLPPKLLFSQECDDVAERMMQLDAYLRALLASPALALSPLVCTFLDAVDVQSFRGQVRASASALRWPAPMGGAIC